MIGIFAPDGQTQISTKLGYMQEVVGGALPTEISLCECFHFLIRLDVVEGLQ
jgi:hypothetical protein